MKAIFGACLGMAILSGCASSPLSPPRIPAPGAVGSFTLELDGLPASVGQVLSNGFALVDRDCAAFFDALERGRQVGEFGAAQLAAIATAASAVMAIAGAGAPAIGYTASGLGLASVTVTNIQRFALLTDFPDEMQRLVTNAQANYKAAVRAEIRVLPAGRVTSADAYAAVVGYARLCTLPGMRRLGREALDTARTSADAPPSAPIAEQSRALRTISEQMGFAQPLSVGEAGALLRFATTGADDPDGMRLRTLLGRRLEPVFTLPAMVPRNAANYSRGIEALRLLAIGFAALRDAAQEGGGAREGTGAVAAPAPGQMPERRQDGEGEYLGGLTIPSIRVVR